VVTGQEINKCCAIGKVEEKVEIIFPIGQWWLRGQEGNFLLVNCGKAINKCCAIGSVEEKVEIIFSIGQWWLRGQEG
jgi:hypothetical protein